MKKLYTLLLASFSFFASSIAQTTLYNGETISPDVWDLGGNPPNGSDSPAGEGWKLNVTGKMDILTEGLNNPYPAGFNTTEKVVRSIRNINGEGWAGAAINISSLNLNMSQISKFSLLVYKEIAGNVSMKIEGAGSQEVTVYYDTPGQWQKLEFVFNPANFSGSPTNLLVFPHNQTGLTETIITYWDEITMYDQTDNSTVIYNGNDPVSGFFLDGYSGNGGPNGTLNHLVTDIFPNLSRSGVNTSNHVIRFLRARDGKSWCGVGMGGLNIDLNVTPVVTILINKAVSGHVGIKLEGGGARELYADYNTPNEWARLSFTFSPGDFTGNPNTLIIFPHFEDTDTSPLSYHTPVYLDDIQLRSTATLSTDYFRSAGSGIWGENSSWESSYNNNSWIAAASTPDNAATEINIQTGHHITVTSGTSASVININPGGQMTLNPGISMNTNTLNIRSNATDGTGSFVDKGTFTSTNNTVEQYLSTGRNWYISSPVSSALRSSVSTAGQVVSYNEATAAWDTEANSAILQPMKGYIAVSPVAGIITLTGTLNTGEKTISLNRHAGVSKEGFQLVGNPYPSYVNFSSATRTNLSSTMWYRTKSATAYVFDTYNAFSGIGTSNNNNQNIAVTGDIAPMQAFWVRALAGGGSLTFDNNDRSHQSQSSVYNRLKTKQNTEVNQQVLRLKISNGTNSDETILVFNPLAINEQDDYDSPKMSNANASIAEIYTMVNNEKMVINGMNNFPAEIPLGFSTSESNSLTIQATEISGFDEESNIILKDNLLNREIILSEADSYGFSSDSTDQTNRFSLIFKTPTTTTDLNEFNQHNSSVVIKNRGKVVTSLKFNKQSAKESSFNINDLTGKRIFNSINTENHITRDVTLESGIYLISVHAEGKIITKKFVVL